MIKNTAEAVFLFFVYKIINCKYNDKLNVYLAIL